jgi:indole-3-glycerol phosphate synthase
LEYLRDIRSAIQLPLLRKDFIIDERQIAESFHWGADAILLIVAILTDHQLAHYLDLARQAGLDALVEVHDDAELDRALAAGAGLLGINNRDLHSFEVRLETTFELHPHVPPGIPVIAESGIRTRADIDRLAAAGVDGVLIGEALVTAADPGGLLSELAGADDG